MGSILDPEMIVRVEGAFCITALSRDNSCMRACVDVYVCFVGDMWTDGYCLVRVAVLQFIRPCIEPLLQSFFTVFDSVGSEEVRL